MAPGRVFALRPYWRTIRSQVERALGRIGYRIVDEVAPRTPDDAVLAWLRRRAAPDALLIPFHAHRDQGGELVDGFSLLRRIRRELADYSTLPVVAPVSDLGLAAAQLIASRESPERRLRGVLMLTQEDLAGDVVPALRRLLRAMPPDPEATIDA